MLPPFNGTPRPVGGPVLWPCHPLSRWPAWCACRCWVLGAGMPTRGAMCVSGARGHAACPRASSLPGGRAVGVSVPECHQIDARPARPWVCWVLVVPTRGPVAGAVGVLFLVASASPKPHHHIEHPARGQLLAWGMPVLAGLPVAGCRAGFRCACPVAGCPLGV